MLSTYFLLCENDVNNNKNSGISTAGLIGVPIGMLAGKAVYDNLLKPSGWDQLSSMMNSRNSGEFDFYANGGLVGNLPFLPYLIGGALGYPIGKAIGNRIGQSPNNKQI